MGWIVHRAHGPRPGSVIVHVIDQDGVTILECESQSPVTVDPHREVPFDEMYERTVAMVMPPAGMGDVRIIVQSMRPGHQ